MNTNAKVKEARHWQAVTSKEMKVFLAFLIISNGLVVLCRLSSIFYPPGVQRFVTPRISETCFLLKNDCSDLIIFFTLWTFRM